MRIFLSGGHWSKYWEEIFIPGRQDNSERILNPEIRSADLIVAPLISNPKILKEGASAGIITPVEDHLRPQADNETPVVRLLHANGVRYEIGANVNGETIDKSAASSQNASSE